MRHMRILKVPPLGLLLILGLFPAALAAADPASRLGRGLDFCGEAVPLHDGPTFEAVDQNLVLLAEARSRVYLSLRRAGRFLPLVEQILSRHSLPDDLKYIPYALTGFDPTYNSGGRGLWRLKEGEARAMGLRVDSSVDERLDPVASTEAAAARLRQLKEACGSWTTAAAALTLGDDVLRRAIGEAGGDANFYRLYLPAGQDQVFAMVLAGKAVFEDPSAFGYRLAGAAWPAWPGRRGQLTRSASVRSLAAQYGVDYKTFRDLNPHLLNDTAPAGALINLP